ncbi:hypothetical protein DFJ77DRAFT_429795, partial [Powellomyces hirtus]
QLDKSATLYVGNLSFFTTEEQIYELFAKCGEIKRIIMGLDKFKKTPCGFCFVEYYYRQDALDCMKYVNGTKLDERIIRTDLDPGYKDGRNLGRGRSGGQVRDEHRDDYDEGRGGWGARLREEEMREKQQRETYENFSIVPDGATSSYYSRDTTGKHLMFAWTPENALAAARTTIPCSYVSSSSSIIQISGREAGKTMTRKRIPHMEDTRIATSSRYVKQTS